ncbi:MAG TPA: hypothetical protein VNJ08_00310 [Bacteriovoracaceae bacterium]|nr:hypothetical protein [Bacteriovoracaceae bacterium]
MSYFTHLFLKKSRETASDFQSKRNSYEQDEDVFDGGLTPLLAFHPKMITQA